MDNIVKYKILVENITGKNIESLKKEVEGMGASVKVATEKTEGLKSSLININQSIQAVQNMAGAFSGIAAEVEKYTRAYDMQIAAESRLAQVMSNTMGASQAEVKSILDLAAAQQKLGVIGDEIQLAGAQELATYASKKATLETLLPVMNDMIAQQYGLNASQESAQSIATMMGKVLEGQTTALHRYGYSFSEAEEKILKFGTEEQRAATLAEVVKRSVGGVNEALAQTPSGKFKQMANEMGDLKEQVGKTLMPFRGLLSVLSEVGMATAGIINVGQAFSGMAKALSMAAIAQKALNLAMKANPYILAATAIAGIAAAAYKAATALNAVQKAQKAATDAIAAANTQFIAEKNQLDYLFSSLNKAEKGSDAYKAAIDRINSKYGEYLPNLLTEKSTVNEITAAYNKATQAIYGKLMAQAKESAMSDTLESGGYASKQLNISQKLKTNLKKTGLSDAEINDVVARIVKNTNEMIASGKYNGNEIVQQAYGNLSVLNGNKFYLADAYENARDLVSVMIELNNSIVTVNNSFLPFESAINAANSSISNLSNTEEKHAETAAKAAKETANAVKKISDAEREAAKNDWKNYVPSAVINAGTMAAPAVNMSSYGPPKPKQQLTYIKTTAEIDFDGATESLKTYLSEREKLKDVSPLQQQIEAVNEYTTAISTLTSSMSALGQAIGGNTGEWISWGANLFNTISQVIPKLMELASANSTAAATGAGAAVASIPVVGPILAVASIASVVAALLAIPKFAAGGIVSGPTLGLFGEYPGAKSNPEVVAPLSKLRGLLDGEGGADGGRVVFKIGYRELIGVLEKGNRHISRT